MATNNFSERQAVKLAKTLKDLTGCDVFKNTRKREYIEVRALYNFILYDVKGYTLHEIKRLYLNNGKPYDHSTVLHSLKQFDVYKRYNPNYDEWIKTLLIDEYDSELIEQLINKKAKGLSFDSLNKLYEYTKRLAKMENGEPEETEEPKEVIDLSDPIKELKGRLILAFRQAEDQKQESSTGLQEALKLLLNLEKELN